MIKCEGCGREVDAQVVHEGTEGSLWGAFWYCDTCDEDLMKSLLEYQDANRNTE